MRHLWLCILSLVFAAFVDCNACRSQEASGLENAESVQTDESPAGAHGQNPPKHVNRLAKESSPYLLQHAHNPVDWYPWGDEAFAKAKREQKMVFLSVGYAACHWCHVMERESFVDDEIAEKLNDGFVCIKVDREERPDVDQIYMTAVQMINGNGGWPMSVFLLPDGRPFWGGTYFPARDGDRGPSTGFLTIIEQIEQAWTREPDKVKAQAEMLTRAVRSSQAGGLEGEKEDSFDRGLVDEVAGALLEQYDPEYGGFGPSTQGPKFPEPSNLVFLLDRWQRGSVNKQRQASARRMLIKTLDGMSSGAMFDHLGGGFHRYSVDRQWQIPHFEKMLYDNGQLVSVYVEAYEKTGDESYRYIIEATCDFVLRELRADGGAFYSSLDADSEGEEGKFYRWTERELEKFESVEGYSDFAKAYRLDQQPNFEGEYRVPDPGKALSRVAEDASQSFPDFIDSLALTREAMMKARERRVRPGTDTKILTAWNGLMVTGLADAGRVLDRNDYKSAAVDAMRFLLKNSRDVNGRLLRSYAGGEARFNAYVDDYAFLASGLVALHRAMGDDRLLKLASQLTDLQIELFWDEDNGGFFFTSSDHPELIVRLKDPVDSAVPSGASVTAENLMYLVQHTDRQDYRDRLRVTLQSFVPLLRQAPAAAPRAAAVMAEYLDFEAESGDE